MKILKPIELLIFCLSSHFVLGQKTLIDFFLPIEPQAPKVSEGIWGDKAVLPRDTANGLEDARLKNWCYWDGSIVKDEDEIYHMYVSRWTQTVAHAPGWKVHSKAIHATSKHLLGPYKDQGLTWPGWNNGAGHNVVGLRMHDGRYAMITSERTPGNVFEADNPYGPWEYLGELEIDANGYYAGWGRYNELDDGALRGGVIGHLSNVMVILRPDGRYMMVARHCVPMISDNGILGPYKMMAEKAWLGVKGLPQFKMEDPTVWYSDGLYHIVVNHHVGDTTYHLTSEDGFHNWKNRGLAFKREREVFKHSDGTVENWHTVQRPTVYVENEIVKAFNFSVIDVHKGQDAGNDENGSKIMVVPFDGEAFGKHIRNIVDEENRIADETPPPSPWKSLEIGAVSEKGNSGFDKEVNTIRVKASGNKLNDKADAFRYVYQKISGDISAKVMLMSHDVTENSIAAGLMIRKSLDSDSPTIWASISKDKKFELRKREKPRETLSLISTKNIEAPYWIRFEKRGNKLSCFLSSSNRLNWEKVADLELELDEDFYVGMAATSLSNKGLSLARFKDAEVHTWGKPIKEGIVSHTFPDTIPVSGKIDFQVEYETNQTLEIWVELQNVQTLEKYKVLRQRLKPKGTDVLHYNAGKPLDLDSEYWFVIKAIPFHFHDSEHVQAAFKKVYVEN